MANGNTREEIPIKVAKGKNGSVQQQSLERLLFLSRVMPAREKAYKESLAKRLEDFKSTYPGHTDKELDGVSESFHREFYQAEIKAQAAQAKIQKQYQNMLNKFDAGKILSEEEQKSFPEKKMLAEMPRETFIGQFLYRNEGANLLEKQFPEIKQSVVDDIKQAAESHPDQTNLVAKRMGTVDVFNKEFPGLKDEMLKMRGDSKNPELQDMGRYGLTMLKYGMAVSNPSGYLVSKAVGAIVQSKAMEPMRKSISSGIKNMAERSGLTALARKGFSKMSDVSLGRVAAGVAAGAVCVGVTVGMVDPENAEIVYNGIVDSVTEMANHSPDTAYAGPSSEGARTIFDDVLSNGEAATPDAATPDAATPDAPTPDAPTPDAPTPSAATPDPTSNADSGIKVTGVDSYEGDMNDFDDFADDIPGFVDSTPDASTPDPTSNADSGIKITGVDSYEGDMNDFDDFADDIPGFVDSAPDAATPDAATPDTSAPDKVNDINDINDINDDYNKLVASADVDVDPSSDGLNNTDDNIDPKTGLPTVSPQDQISVKDSLPASDASDAKISGDSGVEPEMTTDKYTIKPGDTLSEIVEEKFKEAGQPFNYDMIVEKVEQITEMNKKIVDPDDIKSGWEIKIPPFESAPPLVSPADINDGIQETVAFDAEKCTQVVNDFNKQNGNDPLQYGIEKASELVTPTPELDSKSEPEPDPGYRAQRFMRA
jgi:hypothetical protein